jgi:hypothetical protein
LRWWRNTLAEVRILHFAIRYEPRIDLRQGLASPAPLRRSSQNRNHTIYKKAIAGFGITPHNPACSQTAMISTQAGWRGAACTVPQPNQREASREWRSFLASLPPCISPRPAAMFNIDRK